MSIIRDGFQSADLDAPVTAPTLNLDFANSQELDPRITFSRGSIGTFVNKNGLIETAPANQPRFDYDPISGECRGLLIEEQRTNDILYSEDFSNSYWTKSNVSIISNAATAPDGSSNASKLVESASSAVHELVRPSDPNLAVVTDTYITLSIFVKAAERKYCYIRSSGNSKRIAAVVDLTNGTFNVTNWGLTLNSSATVTPYPNGWYKVTITSQSNFPTAPGWSGNFTVSPLNSFQNASNVGGSGYSYPGDGNSGIYIWGAQYEKNAFPTSYIPTTVSTVTRSTELASMTGTNFSSWYNQSEGTFFVSGKATIVQNARILSFNEPTFGVLFVNANAANSAKRGIWGPSTLSNVYGISAFSEVPINSSYKAAAAIKFPNYYTNYSLNGQISTASRLPNTTLYNNVNQLQIGPSAGGGSKGNIISRITYYPKALSPAQLQYLTQ